MSEVGKEPDPLQEEPQKDEDQKSLSSLDKYLADVNKQKQENPAAYYIAWPAIMMQVIWAKHGQWLKLAMYLTFIILYCVYLVFASVLGWPIGGMALNIMTYVVLFCVAWEYLVTKNWALLTNHSCARKTWEIWNKWWCQLILLLIWLAILIAITVIDALKKPYCLVSLLGWWIMVYMLVIVSLHPHRIVWRPVIWGFGLSYIFALIVMRTVVGRDVMEFVAYYVTKFLGFADVGAEFVFGQEYYTVWAFFIMPVIIYFAAVVAWLYYIGFMEWIIKKFAWWMEVTLTTSAAESIVAAANIFIGQTESPLLIRPFLWNLTTAEIVSVMSCGFASIAGSVLGAYIAMGIDATQLLTACITSAPAALACAKLVHPDIERSKYQNQSQIKIEGMGVNNFIEALSMGASQAIPLTANICAMLIAFLSILAFLDAVCIWLGLMIGIEDPELTIDRLLGYCFWVFAWLCGVYTDDCLLVGQLMGLRIFANEFIAFEVLGVSIDYRDPPCCFPKRDKVPEDWYLDDEGQIVQGSDDWTGQVIWPWPHSETVATYALCGFANFGSMGIMIGGLSGIAPERQSDIAKMVGPGLAAGNMACFIRGAIAGLLFSETRTDEEVEKGWGDDWHANDEGETDPCYVNYGGRPPNPEDIDEDDDWLDTPWGTDTAGNPKSKECAHADAWLDGVYEQLGGTGGGSFRFLKEAMRKRS